MRDQNAILSGVVAEDKEGLGEEECAAIAVAAVAAIVAIRY